MRVVLNLKHGGFGLSHEAKIALVGCGHQKLQSPDDYWGEDTKMRALIEAAPPSSIFSLTLLDGQIVTDDHDRLEHRSCARLIEVVERMGRNADGQCSKLAVVEIPDGIEWSISEYDGFERAEEKHRSWP